MHSLHDKLVRSADEVCALNGQVEQDPDQLSSAKHAHRQLQKLHRVSMRSVMQISILGSSMAGKRDCPTPANSFVSSVLRDCPTTTCFELLNTCGVARPYSSFDKTRSQSSKGGEDILQQEVSRLNTAVKNNNAFVG